MWDEIKKKCVFLKNQIKTFIIKLLTRYKKYEQIRNTRMSDVFVYGWKTANMLLSKISNGFTT